MTAPKPLSHLQLRQAEWFGQCFEGPTRFNALQESQCREHAGLGAVLSALPPVLRLLLSAPL